jgi:hypothetical protein
MGRGEPVFEAEDGHHHDVDRLPEQRRDALGTERLVRVANQSEDRVAKFSQDNQPRGAAVLGRCQRDRAVRGVEFQGFASECGPWPGQRVLSLGGRILALCPARIADYRQTSIDPPTSAERYRSSGTGYHRPSCARTQ